jgi:hypothetical protein
VKYLLVLCAACGAAGVHGKKTDGAIAGLVRDRDSGQPIGAADLSLSTGAAKTTGIDGMYIFDPVKPGRYTLVATYAGHTVTTKDIDVRRNEVSFVDVTFALGQPDPITVQYGDPKLTEIWRYTPKDHVSRIEGTVSEAATHTRLGGVVVTAAAGDTLQTVSDDDGRYHFDHVPTGTYTVSAYYSVAGHGQIEVRRSDIRVDNGEAVVVPLQVEATKQ